MSKTARNILVVILLLIAGVIAGGMYLSEKFFSAFAPDKITITETEILSSNGFINPITIEKIKVDSFDEEQTPVKYTIDHVATCDVKQEPGKPPVALKKIKLNEPGRYTWTEQSVNIPIIHKGHQGRLRERLDSVQTIIWSMGKEKSDICPMKFERDQWYFITFHDPQIVGAFVFIDNKGNLRQHMKYTGVSPI